MPQFGSNPNLISQNLSQTVDNQGNPIISSSTSFGASPLGYAARAQALFGLPNSTFELTPPDPTVAISALNPMPYWDVQNYSDNVMTATSVFDSTTNSWGVKLDPGTATTNDYLTFTTRSYLINDDNLALRQQALAVVTKNGTYASTTQWNLELTASYYDTTDTLLHSGTVATIYDNATWTSMAGTTTTGGSAINAAAHYVDLTFTLTATAAVTSATSVTIKSCILQTSTGSTGGQSFLVTDTYTSSGTWTRPTGVNYLVAVVGIGAGGGGGGGNAVIARASTANTRGGGGGGGSRWAVLRDLYVGDVSSVTIGIGAAGVGGAGGTANKAAGSTTTNIVIDGALATSGGTTTFGSFMSIPGGAAGTAYDAAGSAGTTAISAVYGFAQITAGAGGQSFSNGVSSAATAYSQLPNTPTPTLSGAAGTAGSASGGSGTTFLTAAGNGGSASWSGGGGGGARDGNVGGNGGAGGGGGGGGCAYRTTVGTATITATGGNGGAAAASSGAGGGGGGASLLSAPISAAGTASYNASTLTATGGNGANGSGGIIYVTYIA